MRKHNRTRQKLNGWGYDTWTSFYFCQRYRRYSENDQPGMTLKEFIHSESIDRRYDAYVPLIDTCNNPLFNQLKWCLSGTADTKMRNAVIAARTERFQKVRKERK